MMMKNALQKLRRKLRNKKGFTLIEMIVVVAIIAILIALLVPNVMKFIGTANNSSASANAKTVFVATQTYIADLYTMGVEAAPANGGVLENIQTTVGGKAIKLTDYLSGDATKGTCYVWISGGACTKVTWQKNTDSPLGTYPKA